MRYKFENANGGLTGEELTSKLADTTFWVRSPVPSGKRTGLQTCALFCFLAMSRLIALLAPSQVSVYTKEARFLAFSF